MEHIPGVPRRKREQRGKNSTFFTRSDRHNVLGRQDYTVIIGWKDWCAFEVEDEADADALTRKRKQRVIVNVDDECEYQREPESKKLKYMRSFIDQGEKSMSIHSGADSVGAIVSGQQGSPPSQADDCAQNRSPGKFIDTAPVEKEEGTSEKPSISVEKKAAVQDIACNHEESKDCSDGMSHPSAYVSIELAHVVTHAPKREAQCNSSLHAKLGDSPSENHFVEEVHDTIVALDGKVKMSDIKTIYEKSKAAKTHSQRDDYNETRIMNVEEHRLVSYERRTKRLREHMGTTNVHTGASMVKCPICQVIIPGDIHDADFNNQINLHVDSCIGSFK